MQNKTKFLQTVIGSGEIRGSQLHGYSHYCYCMHMHGTLHCWQLGFHITSTKLSMALINFVASFSIVHEASLSGVQLHRFAQHTAMECMKV